MSEIQSVSGEKTLSKKAKKGILIVCFLVFASLLTAVLHFSSFDVRIANENSAFSRGEEAASVPKLHNPLSVFSSFGFSDYIAVLHVEGTIQDSGETYNHGWMLDTIADLANDSKNRGILLYIDSPGGGVYQSDEVYLALESYKYKTENPVWAYMGHLAASGGYYIACAADIIYANRNTLTGSIGVISATSLDLTALMAKYGIKMTTITAGKNKNMFNINSPMTDEQREIMQAIADEAYDQFTEIIAESRQMELSQVRRLADGRLYTAYQAEQNGLIDYVTSYENTLDDMLDIFYDGDSLAVKHFRFERKKNLSDYLYQASVQTAALFGLKTANPDVLLSESMQKLSGLPEKLPLPAYYYRAP